MTVPTATVLAIGLAWTLCGIGWADSPRAWVLPSAGEAFQGGILELRVPARGLVSVEGQFGGEKISFLPESTERFTGLLGIDLEAKPGPAKVYLKALTAAGAYREGHIPLLIRSKAFPQESFKVPPQFDQLGPEVLERIRIEREQLARVFASSTPSWLWQKPFIVPVHAEISSPFGYRRIINGTPRAPHGGVDLRAPMATEVVAANSGRIALTGDFFYSGKSLVVDHGGGLYTMYFHLSEIRVAEGASVRKGELIALSGMSGRVTGPHLHWAARLNSARIDPFELVQQWRETTAISMPKTTPPEEEPRNGR